MKRARVFHNGRPKHQSFPGIGVDFEDEFVGGEGRRLAGVGPGKAARPIEADDLSFKNTVQGVVQPGAGEKRERTGIDPFDEKPPAAAMAQEKAARFPPGKFEGLRPEMPPGLLAEIDVHFSHYNKFRGQGKNGRLTACAPRP